VFSGVFLLFLIFLSSFLSFFLSFFRLSFLSDSVLNKKSKKLTPGELKRLSIAEEMVAGPKLLLMDEPTTGVNIFEVVVLCQTFRELVNQDRTVVASIHQPTAEEFKLFDILLLLSKGRVIYHGPVHNASSFFISSPFGFDYRNYANPADFVTDISGAFISDSKGEFIDSSILENHYLQSESFQRLTTALKSKMLPKQPSLGSTGRITTGEAENPIAAYASPQRKQDLNNQRDSNISSGGFDDSSHLPGQSIEIDNSDPSYIGTSINNQKKKPYALLFLQAIIDDTFAMPTRDNISNLFFKGSVLVHRTILALINRYEMILSSNIIHLFLALMFGWIMGDSSGSAGIYNTNSFFAVSSMFLMIANVAFVFYMFNSSQVSGCCLFSFLLCWFLFFGFLSFLSFSCFYRFS
jgi:hypothetical protein